MNQKTYYLMLYLAGKCRYEPRIKGRPRKGRSQFFTLNVGNNIDFAAHDLVRIFDQLKALS